MAGFETLLAAAAAGAGTTAAASAGATASSFALFEALGAGTAAGFNAASAAGATAAGAAGLGTALNLLGTGVSAGGQIISGQQAKKASKAEAAEFERLAGEEKAAAQRKAAEKRRQMNLLLSRSQAVSAASGAGATDPTVLATEGGIVEEGEYQAGVETYLGETRARGYQGKAALARAEGDDASTSSLISAGGTILSGIGSYYDRYGRRGGTALRYG
jgi:hypothetical protein